MLLQHAAGGFPLDMEGTWGWQDGCVLGPAPCGRVPREVMGNGTDFASRVWPRDVA